MMNQLDIEKKVVKTIAEKLNIDESRVIAEASIMEDLGADSLDSVDIIMALEEDFEIDIPEEDAQKIITVQNAFDYVAAKSVDTADR
jgi:acyl carrier protein